MQHQVVFKEKYGPDGREITYVKPPDQKTLVKIDSGSAIHKTLFHLIASFFKQVFLPHGYPHSVSDDYYNYQKWDTIQAFCSTITGTLTTRAIMTGVGVGDNTATPLAATITWILKDGTGMVGRILFAWWKSTSLDSNCKQWRLVADIINDAAMLMELSVPFLINYVTHILCVATTLKAIVGVAGGATRAAITQHQSIKNNMADVSAKDGSQETLVNLFASFVGIYVISHVKTTEMEWKLFLLLTAMHLYANYKAVKSLKMKSLNSPRFLILLESYISQAVILSPEVVNARESVFLGFSLTDKRFCGFNITLGDSLGSAAPSGIAKSELLKLVTNIQKKRKYLLMADAKKRHIHVILSQEENSQDIIKAYFHAVLLGIATCITTREPLPILKFKNVTSPLSRLNNAMDKFMQGMSSNIATAPPLGQRQRFPVEAMLALEELVDAEMEEFIGGLERKGWITGICQFTVDEWRGTW